ncbi:hypothetical protein U1E44_16215 [Arenibacter sp. GZD96]|uniref:hypothetical protein n=1 Tax=Aurantibrevibacter litoralis TaxID=3106030 RepID=UPI002AFF3F7B|nr:hypothetical protein [Arenibacter sp. GZD-96]MEA1787647.1 hypothetical protein [Arenibacter sp. GZD-96]
MKKPFFTFLVLVAMCFIQCTSDNSTSTEDFIENQNDTVEENTSEEVGENDDDNTTIVDDPDGSNTSEGEDATIDETVSGDDQPANNDNEETIVGCDNEDIVFEDQDTSMVEGECAQFLNEGSIKSITNGEAFDSSGILATGIYGQDEDVFTLSISGGDGIDASRDIDQRNQRGVALAISSTNLGFDDLEVGVTYNGTNGNNLLNGGFELFLFYVKIIDCESVEGGLDISPTASLEFSKIDRQNQLLSGTFEFLATDPDTGNTFPVVNGTFTDIWYCRQSSNTGKMNRINKKIRSVLAK